MSEDRDFDAAALIGLALMTNPNGTLERLGGGGEFHVESTDAGSVVLSDRSGERYRVETRELLLPMFVPANIPTARATAAAVNSADGAFTLSFQELRQVSPSVPNAPFDPAKQAFFEVSRVELSPLALRLLQRNIELAVEEYESLYGRLPLFDDMVNRLGSKASPQRFLRDMQPQQKDGQ